MKEEEKQRKETRRPREPEEDRFRRSFYQQPVPYPRREYLTSPFYPKMPVIRQQTKYYEDRAEISEFINGAGPERAVNTSEVKCAIDFIQRVKDFYPGDSDIFIRFLEVMKEFKMGKKTIEDVAIRVGSIFNENATLIGEFQRFLPHVSGYLQIKNDKLDEGDAVDFITAAKQRFAKEPEMYASFIRILSFLKNKPVPEERFKELEDLLSGYPDLVEQLHRFLPECDIKREPDNTPLSKINEKLKNSGAHESFLKCINAVNQKLISNSDLIFILRPILGDEDIDEMKRYLDYDDVESEMPTKKLRMLKKEGSYRILPENLQVSYEKNGNVLNKMAVGCPTHEREDEHYVFLKRNIYEETLFRIEDERYEIDQQLSRIETLIVALEKMSDDLKIKSTSDPEDVNNSETMGVNTKIIKNEAKIAGSSKEVAMDAVDLSVDEIALNDFDISGPIMMEILEFVYGDAASDVLDGLLGRPIEVVPIVLERMYVVDASIREERARKCKAWEEITRANHYKSLESEFCDFKTIDKKNLGHKCVLKEMVGKRKIDKTGLSMVKRVTKAFESVWELKTNVSKTAEDIVNILNANCVFYCNTTMFFSFSYAIILSERLGILKKIPKKFVGSSLARRLGIQQHEDVEDRQEKSLEIICEFVKNKISPIEFEDEIRFLTESAGYPLFNVDKIVNKMCNKIAVLVEDSIGNELFNDVVNGCSSVEKTMVNSDDVFKFTVKDDEINIELVDTVTKHIDMSIIEKIRNLDYDENLIQSKVFLESSAVPLNQAFSNFGVEHYLCQTTESIKCVPGTEDVFIRDRVGRNKRRKTKNGV